MVWRSIDLPFPPGVIFMTGKVSAKVLWTAMIEFQREFDWDFIKINPRSSYHVEDWGVRLEFSNDPLSKHKKISFPVKSKNDWEKIRVLDCHSRVLGETLAACKDILAGAGDDIHCVQTVFSPLSIAADLVGSDMRFLELMHEDSEKLHSALEAITETFFCFVHELFNIGISGIFFATTEWASRDLLTEEEYLEFGRNYDLKILRAVASGKFNILHVCGKNNMLPLVVDYPVPAISWNPFENGNLSINQAAQITDKIFIAGMDQNRTLYLGTKFEIESQIEKSLGEAEFGRLIIGPGCTLIHGTPMENLKIARKIIEKWSYDRQLHA